MNLYGGKYRSHVFGAGKGRKATRDVQVKRRLV